ncbi:MAG: radical protein [Bryobacterales bacterium]|nr:radical protein [Bryobacterales bacterium]
MNDRLERLPILILNPHNRCNCRCVMCDIWKTDSIRELSAADLERHAADLVSLHVRWVVLSGGEPLMHSDLFRLCRVLREREIRITLLSTGLLLRRHREQVVEYIDDVIVSLDGPAEIHDRIRRVAGAFAALADGVSAIHELRADFPVAVRSTVQKANCGSLRATAAAARQVGARSISFLAADVSSTAFNRDTVWPLPRQDDVAVTGLEIRMLEEEIEALIAEGECGGFVSESPAKLRRIAVHFRARLDRVEPEAPRCNAPWVSAVIEADGTVKPCFFHPPIGRVQAGVSLAEVLNGVRAQAFRRDLDVATNPVCRRCVCSLHFRDVTA